MARVDHMKCSLYNIASLRGMAAIWRKLAKGARNTPSDVPPGHLAVNVGNAGRRFIIRTSYLNHPVFRQLLDQAFEEYGHNHDGPLTIPCNELIFEEIIQSLHKSRECQSIQSCCLQATAREVGIWRDSEPLLHGFPGRLSPTW